ncbi:MAG: hypothetical protein ACP5N2_03815 [Candidatus Nanoarchaeia archaeon]
MDSVILATIRENKSNKRLTTLDYKQFIEREDKKSIANLVYFRFYDRYIKPFQYPSKDYRSNYKHGFAIIASCCLMIEALESFYQGLEHTRRKGEGERVFKDFFIRYKHIFLIDGVFFYKYVRCGILHQAETINGIRIIRSGETYNAKSKTINATLFLTKMERALKLYKADLEKSAWESEIWINLRKKMKFTIDHCVQ